MRGDHEDPDALLARAARDGAKLVYLSNPDNPMGTLARPRTASPRCSRCPPRRHAAGAGRGLCGIRPGRHHAPRDRPDDPRVIRLRTFSKAHGLAGRAWATPSAHPELIAAFDKVRNHFGMNPHQPGRRAGRAGRSGLAGTGAGPGRGGPRPHRRHRRRQRPDRAALGHQLRRRRLRRRRRASPAGC
jgi:histidinol-phosphate/aromatic aminotransferase/cobyric acid decarboxylase-like protein